MASVELKKVFADKKVAEMTKLYWSVILTI